MFDWTIWQPKKIGWLYPTFQILPPHLGSWMTMLGLAKYECFAGNKKNVWYLGAWKLWSTAKLLNTSLEHRVFSTEFTYITLWLFNIAMENAPFIDDFPIYTSIYKGFSMAMLVITRWYKGIMRG